jgi:hypothetical protein
METLGIELTTLGYASYVRARLSPSRLLVLLRAVAVTRKRRTNHPKTHPLISVPTRPHTCQGALLDASKKAFTVSYASPKRKGHFAQFSKNKV